MQSCLVIHMCSIIWGGMVLRSMMQVLLRERSLVRVKHFGLVPAALLSVAFHRSPTYAAVHCCLAITSLGFHSTVRRIRVWKAAHLTMVVACMYATAWSHGAGGFWLLYLHAATLALVLSLVRYDTRDTGNLPVGLLFALAGLDTVLSVTPQTAAVRATLLLTTFSTAWDLRQCGMERCLTPTVHAFYVCLPGLERIPPFLILDPRIPPNPGSSPNSRTKITPASAPPSQARPRAHQHVYLLTDLLWTTAPRISL